MGAVLPKEKPGAVEPKPGVGFPVEKPAVFAPEPEVVAGFPNERLGLPLPKGAAAGVLPNEGEAVLLPKVKPDADAPAILFKGQTIAVDPISACNDGRGKVCLSKYRWSAHSHLLSQDQMLRGLSFGTTMRIAVIRDETSKVISRPASALPILASLNAGSAPLVL